MSKKVLVIGAGAIGQVYAYHLKQAGCAVFFYAKEKYASELRENLTLFPLNQTKSRQAPTTFKVDGVLTSKTEASQIAWDQIYLCISSTALRGDWIDGFKDIAKHATIICLQGGLGDQEFLLKHFSRDQLVYGMISMISYHAPLPGESVKGQGMAYWFPPMGPSPFSGPNERVRDVVTTLNKGKHPAKVIKDVPGTVPFMSAALMSLIVVLELEQWSFKKVLSGHYLALGLKAIKESNLIIKEKSHKSIPLPVTLLSAPIIKLVVRISPKVIPLDIETYLKIHFTKVRDQTILYLNEIIESGCEMKMNTKSLEELMMKMKSA